MLMLIVLAALVVLGWQRWPWWTPFAAFACVLPLMFLQIGVASSWRAEAGLPTHDAASIAINLAANLVLYNVAYWAGRGARRLFSGRATVAAS